MDSPKAGRSIAAARTTARPFVWADVTASDDEDEVGAPLPEAPAVDDSYREAPLASLENSCDALNRGVADLAGPKAFKFPFQAPTQEDAESTASRGAADAARPKTLASSSQALSLSGTLSRPSPSTPSPRSTWQPNPNAPDFIPILSTEYRVVCVCISGDAGTPDKGAEPLQGFGGDRGRRGSAAGRKRQPPALKVPALKRTKSEERRPPSSALPGQSQMPPASEEEWQHRITMRKKAVSVGKETPEYKWLAESRHQHEGEPVEPRTPDPTDRTVSKRHWKYAVQVWRSALKHRYAGECGGSVVSTEEWQTTSVATTEEPWSTATIDGDNDSTA